MPPTSPRLLVPPRRSADRRMTALPSTGRSAWSRSGNPVPRLAVWCGGFAGVAACCCGGVLILRRLGGAFAAAPGGGPLLAATAVGIALVLVADQTARTTGRAGPAWAARLGLILTVAALVMFPRRGAADWIVPAISILAAGAAVVPRHRRPRDDRFDRRPRRPRSGRRTMTAARPAVSQPQPGGPTGSRLWQRLERFEDPTGIDTLRGRIVLVVPAGAKGAHGHMGFCPAFVRTPQVAVTTDYDGVEATLAAAEVLPWGVRVECRLAEPADEPVEIPVDLLVRTGP